MQEKVFGKISKKTSRRKINASAFFSQSRMRKTFHRLKKILDLNYADSYVIGVLRKPSGKKRKKLKRKFFQKVLFLIRESLLM